MGFFKDDKDRIIIEREDTDNNIATQIGYQEELLDSIVDNCLLLKEDLKKQFDPRISYRTKVEGDIKHILSSAKQVYHLNRLICDYLTGEETDNRK